MGFLREEFRQKLIEELVELGVPPSMAERVADIDEGDHDAHRWAHARICEQNAVGQHDASPLHLALSITVLDAIQQEANAREMGIEDFPRSHALMQKVILERSQSTTRH